MKELLNNSEIQQVSQDNESFPSVFLKNVNRYYHKSQDANYNLCQNKEIMLLYVELLFSMGS